MAGVGTNQLIAALPSKLRVHLQEISQEVDLPLGQTLEEPGEPIAHVYFVEAGMVSVVATDRLRHTEIGMIGREGATGVAVILGAVSSPHRMTVQGAGSARRVP